MSRANLNKEPHEVAAMFDAVAKKYDITNDVLSLGQTRSWRKAVVSAVAPTVGEEILDLAAGTGTSTQPFYEAGQIQSPVISALECSKLGASNTRI